MASLAKPLTVNIASRWELQQSRSQSNCCRVLALALGTRKDVCCTPLTDTQKCCLPSSENSHPPAELSWTVNYFVSGEIVARVLQHYSPGHGLVRGWEHPLLCRLRNLKVALPLLQEKKLLKQTHKYWKRPPKCGVQSYDSQTPPFVAYAFPCKYRYTLRSSGFRTGCQRTRLGLAERSEKGWYLLEGFYFSFVLWHQFGENGARRI